MSHDELRQFVYGIVVGITIVILCFMGISYIAGVKWAPVPWDTETFNSTQIPD